MSRAIAPKASWLEMPRVLVPVGLAIALVSVPFAATLWVDRGTEEALAEAHADLLITRDAISAHATAMRGQGERLIRAAPSSVSVHRDHWIGDAREMIADASRLETTARMIDSQARLLGRHPGQTVRSSLSFAHDAGDALVAEGAGLMVHGQAMREHGRAMVERARVRETDITTADATLLSAGADRLIDAGVRTRTVGEALQRVGDQFMRSLGR